MCGVRPIINTEIGILVVDDDESVRTFLPDFLLQGMNFSNVATAENGHHAMERLSRACTIGKPFGIVISDYHMPKMNGGELLMNIKADERFNGTQFILMSSINALDDIRAEDKGRVVAFISKPISHEVMKDALQKASHEILMASR